VGAENPVTSCAPLKTLPSACRRWPLTLPSWANDVHLFSIRCGGCTAEWAGEDRAHCAGCHTTFDSIVLFYVHRDGGSCLRPQVLGLVATKNGIWQEPASKRRVAGS
jgi:hypothetical protein